MKNAKDYAQKTIGRKISKKKFKIILIRMRYDIKCAGNIYSWINL